ncbi:MAG: hypothetical protein ACI85U_004055 [Candidatus Promineifilaceae bacterium]|jgi:hypothetical protein
MLNYSIENNPVFQNSSLLFQPFSLHDAGIKQGMALRTNPLENSLKWLDPRGVHLNGHVLVLGADNIGLLQQLAKLVGCKGEITVLSNDLLAMIKLESASHQGQFLAKKPFAGEKSDLDLRRPVEKYARVKVNIEPLLVDVLPFQNDHFDAIWIEQVPEIETMGEYISFTSELERVGKRVAV